MSEQKWLADASAILAAIHDEQGGEYVKQHMPTNHVGWAIFSAHPFTIMVTNSYME